MLNNQILESRLIMHFMKPKIWPIVITSSLLCAAQIAIVVLTSYHWTETKKNYHLENDKKIYKNSIVEIEKRYSALSKLSMKNDIDKPEIQKILYDAANATPESQKVLRDQLYRKLLPLYQALILSDIRQFQFHLPGSISFLRFHKPEKYGDSLKGFRKMIDTVNATHKPVSGFEEGRANNGFRFVYPLFYQGKFVGSVEFGYSSSIIRKEMKSLFNANTEVILFKDYIDKIDFEDARSVYGSTSLGKLFYIDNDSYQRIDPDNKKLYDLINQNISKHIPLKPDHPGIIALPMVVDKKYFDVYLYPIISYNGRHAGYIVLYHAEDELKMINIHFWQMVWAGSGAAVVISILLSVLFYRLKLAQTKLRQIAYTDKLTGILNRSSLYEDFEYLCKLSKRLNQPMSMIFFDIDFFKKINDTYGHDMGDQVLIELSRLIEKRLRKTDIFGRWGGEEFIIALPNTSLEDACEFCETLRKNIENHKFSNGHITCSFGVATLLHEETYEDLISRVDKKLYESKGNGRNCIST